MSDIRIRHPLTGSESVVPESAVPHWRAAGWQLVEEAEPEDDGLDELTVQELRDVARGRELPVSGTKAELLERLRGQQQQAEPEGAAEHDEEEA